MPRTLLPLLILSFAGVGANAQVITIMTQSGEEQAVPYRRGTLKRAGVRTDAGMIDYGQIASISTDDFDAYEDAVNRAAKRGNEHLTVEFTGEENVNALRLERLERRRAGAGAAKGAGGIMMLLGVLAGDSDLTAVGMATYGAGNVAQRINTEETIAAQNEAIFELQQQQQRATEDEELSLEETFRLEYGNENVDSLIALVDRNYERALALANAGETSSDANYRMWAVWMKAIIFADQGDRQAVEQEYQRLIVLDPEVETVADLDMWMTVLLGDLNEMREG